MSFECEECKRSSGGREKRKNRRRKHRCSCERRHCSCKEHRSSGRRRRSSGRRRRSSGGRRRFFPSVDIVILTFNPGTGVIVAAFTSGNTFPCTTLLTPTGVTPTAAQAISCLESSGFRLEAFSESGGFVTYKFARFNG